MSQHPPPVSQTMPQHHKPAAPVPTASQYIVLDDLIRKAVQKEWLELDYGAQWWTNDHAPTIYANSKLVPTLNNFLSNRWSELKPILQKRPVAAKRIRLKRTTNDGGQQQQSSVQQSVRVAAPKELPKDSQQLTQQQPQPNGSSSLTTGGPQQLKNPQHTSREQIEFVDYSCSAKSPADLKPSLVPLTISQDQVNSSQPNNNKKNFSATGNPNLPTNPYTIGDLIGTTVNSTFECCAFKNSKMPALIAPFSRLPVSCKATQGNNVHHNSQNFTGSIQDQAATAAVGLNSVKKPRKLVGPKRGPKSKRAPTQSDAESKKIIKKTKSSAPRKRTVKLRYNGHKLKDLTISIEMLDERVLKRYTGLEFKDLKRLYPVGQNRSRPLIQGFLGFNQKKSHPAGVEGKRRFLNALPSGLAAAPSSSSSFTKLSDSSVSSNSGSNLPTSIQTTPVTSKPDCDSDKPNSAISRNFSGLKGITICPIIRKNQTIISTAERPVPPKSLSDRIATLSKDITITPAKNDELTSSSSSLTSEKAFEVAPEINTLPPLPVEPTLEVVPKINTLPTSTLISKTTPKAMPEINAPERSISLVVENKSPSCKNQQEHCEKKETEAAADGCVTDEVDSSTKKGVQKENDLKNVESNGGRIVKEKNGEVEVSPRQLSEVSETNCQELKEAANKPTAEDKDVVGKEANTTATDNLKGKHPELPEKDEEVTKEDTNLSSLVIASCVSLTTITTDNSSNKPTITTDVPKKTELDGKQPPLINSNKTNDNTNRPPPPSKNMDTSMDLNMNYTNKMVQKPLTNNKPCNKSNKLRDLLVKDSNVKEDSSDSNKENTFVKETETTKRIRQEDEQPTIKKMRLDEENLKPNLKIDLSRMQIEEEPPIRQQPPPPQPARPSSTPAVGTPPVDISSLPSLPVTKLHHSGDLKKSANNNNIVIKKNQKSSSALKSTASTTTTTKSSGDGESKKKKQRETLDLPAAHFVDYNCGKCGKMFKCRGEWKRHVDVGQQKCIKIIPPITKNVKT